MYEITEHVTQIVKTHKAHGPKFQWRVFLSRMHAHWAPQAKSTANRQNEQSTYCKNPRRGLDRCNKTSKGCQNDWMIVLRIDAFINLGCICSYWLTDCLQLFRKTRYSMDCHILFCQIDGIFLADPCKPIEWTLSTTDWDRDGIKGH